MRNVAGCDLEEYKRYYRTLDDLHNYFRTLGLTDATFGELGSTEEEIIKRDPSQLIVWRENNEIIGHAVWHETSTDEHREGDPRDREDRKVLRELCGGKKDNIVELHEIWLRKKHRGKGYGKGFFEFFEEFIRKRGYDSIVYYTDNPAAIAICRNRGWKESFLAKENWHVFCLSF
ncbi:GNAT family N-acetyltransferase [Candidatus Bathyarchaeota archaeon]|nr:GNAT family N-acetyltransferase [Candidatus Bathyarchaeota archaeon]